MAPRRASRVASGIESLPPSHIRCSSNNLRASSFLPKIPASHCSMSWLDFGLRRRSIGVSSCLHAKARSAAPAQGRVDDPDCGRGDMTLTDVSVPAGRGRSMFINNGRIRTFRTVPRFKASKVLQPTRQQEHQPVFERPPILRKISSALAGGCSDADLGLRNFLPYSGTRGCRRST